MACCDRHLVRGTLFVGSPDQHPSDRHLPLVTATRHFAFGGNSKRNGCHGLCHRFERFPL